MEKKMPHLIIGMIIALAFLPVQAADIPEVYIQDQQNDQSQCEVLRSSSCIAMCQTSDDSNCTQLCKETAKNECLEAGE